MKRSTVDFKKLSEVAQGRREADLYIDGGQLINVYSGEIYSANIAVHQGRIAYVGTARSMIGSNTCEIKAEGYYLSPGYMECHAHPWVGYNPVSMVEGVLPMGTTTMVYDNLFFFLHGGEKGVAKLMDWMSNIPANLYWTARAFPQTPYDGEAAHFTVDKIKELFSHPRVLGIGEITRWPLLAEGNEDLLELVNNALDKRLRIDGHTAGCSYERLNTVASIIDSCHEAITAEEVASRLRLGIWVMLRHSSLRQDLPELLRAVKEKGLDTTRMMLTTDGSAPSYTTEFGFMDGLIRLAVSEGIDPIRALQMATVNPATYWGLDKEIGGLAPGRRADILLLPDLQNFRPDLVLSGGKVVAEKGQLLINLSTPTWQEFGLMKPFSVSEKEILQPELYGIPAEDSIEFPVIDFISNVITKELKRTLYPEDGFLTRDEDLLYCALFGRDGKWRSLGFVRGLGKIEALASTYNTSSHLLVLGENRQAMAQAAARVVKMGGGICLLRDGTPAFELPLEIAGMMSGLSYSEVAEAIIRLEKEVMNDGFPFNDLLYCMLFMVCDFLPGLRLTPKGLLDVKSGRLAFPALTWK